jgi:hypothetical protein
MPRIKVITRIIIIIIIIIIIHEISGSISGKCEIKEIHKTAILGTALVFKKLLMWKYKRCHGK